MYFSCCWKPVTEVWLVVIQCLGTLGWMHSTHHCRITWCLTSLPWQTAQQGKRRKGRNVSVLVCDWVCAERDRERECKREGCIVACKCVCLFTEHNLNSPQPHTTSQPWPVKHTVRDKVGKIWRWNDGGGGGQEERGAATAKDSRNVTEKEGGEKIALPDLPSFGMHPIYPVRVCVYVCVWHAGRKAFSI